MKSANEPRVLIVGTGFGGLNAARELAKHRIRITVVDRANFHTFQPLLYQVATAGLSPAEIAAPIRWITRGQRNIEVMLGEIEDFDLERRVAKWKHGEIPYDYLIVAAGARHSYFGHPEWEGLAPGLKTIEDAIEIRRRILLSFELAEREAARGDSHPPLNFVVVGGGPTGVELAGTLAEIARQALSNEFHSIDPKSTRILLLEGGPRILPSFSADLSASAEKQLRHLGVEVRTSAQVTGIGAGWVQAGDLRLPSAVTLWAAGVEASELGRKLTPEVDRAGRVAVNGDLSLPGHREVFVIGDLAAFKDPKGNLLPGVAPVAMQEGTHVARNIASDLSHRERSDFRYVDRGNLATIGRNAAVAQFGRLHISGYPAWLAWLFIHIFFLIGFRNRLMVMIQWAWAYFTYERGARLITGSQDLPGWSELEEQFAPGTTADRVSRSA